jgi:uncharacterized protein
MGSMSAEADLIKAVKSGDLGRVCELMDQEPSLSAAKDDSGVSALMTAAYYGHPAIAEAIAGRRQGQLDVFEATIMGYSKEVETMVSANPSLLSAFSKDGFNALQFAAFFGKKDVARVLLDVGADANVVSRNAMGVAPLHSALAGGYLEIARMLLEGGADASAQSGEGWTPLHYAADIGDAEVAKELIAMGARGGVPNSHGKTAEELGDEVGHGHVSDVIRSER